MPEENGVTTTFGFQLQCRECKEEFLVGDAVDFNEQPADEPRTAYYPPGPHTPVDVMGISEGTGDTFECFPCHIVKWCEDNPKEPSNG